MYRLYKGNTLDDEIAHLILWLWLADLHLAVTEPQQQQLLVQQQ